MIMRHTQKNDLLTWKFIKNHHMVVTSLVKYTLPHSGISRIYLTTHSPLLGTSFMGGSFFEMLVLIIRIICILSNIWLMFTCLTHWLPTTSILVVMGKLTATNSNAIIWKTESFLSIFYCIFGIYINFWIFWNKMSLIAQVFLNLLTPKDVLT